MLVEKTSLSHQEWDKKIKDFSGSILQSWAWGEFQKAIGHKVIRLSSNDWAAQVIEFDLIMSKKYWYAPRGPIGNALVAAQSMRQEIIQDHSVIFLRLEPYEPVGLPEAPKTIQPKENWMIGLEGSEEELLTAMKPKHRYNINLATKKGVKVREATKDDFLNVWALLLETAARGKFRLHPQNYYLQMWETLGSEYLKVFIAELDGQALACSLVTFFGHTATYLHGGSSDKNKQFMAPYLLHWEAMRTAKHLSYFNYDLGGYTSDENHPWAGISRFKKGFGGFEVKYPGTFDMVLSPLWYNVYSQGRKLRNLLR
ncbi:MAG: peptidoglycan bridge formation glycyltransferase FemA/FemB family protein [Candidatus Doudnabacteria bacterium]|nr:peptidoglycan bridge formation glycyltransferase FemA/FemB family protein [Candidatus Doudnabacteria bacterium]